MVRVQASDSLCITKDRNKTKNKTNMDYFELPKALTMAKNKNVELEMCKIGPVLCFVIPICRIITYYSLKGSISPVGVSSWWCHCVTLDLLSTPLNFSKGLIFYQVAI